MSELPRELQDALKERYEIQRELGRGGMAIVYLAKDLKLGREVAIKVLLPDLAAVMGAERFAREIDIAGRLSNPHILPIYDSGNANGQLYFVMPFIRGESMRARLDREKQLPIDEALRLTIEVAQALDYAHKQGVIHRDIKPENILLEGGHAVLADFGIARAASAASQATALTATGMTLGTASYMSPEQVAAEKDLDGRSDVYSLACVLYEMLAGHPPFTGPNSAAIMARHALEMPPSLTVVRSTIPDEVEEVVFQALAKSRVDRFESAGDFADALQDSLAATPTVMRRTTTLRQTANTAARRRFRKRKKYLLVGAIAVPTIAAVLFSAKMLSSKSPGGGVAVAGAYDTKKVAVLYFDDESNGKLAYLADGLTETLIDQLEGVQAVDVISRDGVSRFRGKNPSNDSVASVLGAGTIVRGSVLENGDRVGINIRIVDGNGGGDQRRKGIELPQGDLLAVRNAVVDSVRTFLSDYLGEEIRTRTLRAGTTNAAAWTLTQRAEKHRKDAIAAAAARDTVAAPQNFALADSLLASAEKLDAHWSAPVAMRSLVALNRAQASRTDVAKWIDQGIALADRAIQMDPNNVDAWESRGRLHYLRWTRNVITDANDARQTLTAADADLSKATELDKTRASAWNTLSNVRSDNDDFTGAKIAATRAYEEDAFLSSIEGVIYNLYRTSYNLEQVQDSRKWCNEGFSRFPKNRAFTRCRLWLRTLSGVTPNVDSAWTDAKEYEELSPPAARDYVRLESQLVVAGTLARASRTDASRRQVLADSARQLLLRVRAAAKEDVDPEHELMGLEAFIRTLFEEKQDTDEAISILRRYVSGNPGHREGLARSQSWWWRSLKPDPRYQALVAGR